MTQFPNWVDLVVILFVLRALYIGYDRGFLTELFSLAGVISVTALCLNYVHPAARWVQGWVQLSPMVVTASVFWGLFLISIIVMRWLVARITDLVKWERLHWMIQGIGMLLGGIRGLWWAGFLLIALTSSGVEYLQQSVEERALLGSRLLPMVREVMTTTADQFPGAQGRGHTLIPPFREVPTTDKQKSS